MGSIDRGRCHEDREGMAYHRESVRYCILLFIYLFIYCFLFLMVFILSTCTNFMLYVKCVNARLMFNVN